MSTMQPLTAPAQSPERNNTNLYPGRLMCLDVFRGLLVAGMILIDNGDDKSYWALNHAEWNGWTPADFIFPSFLFLVGASLVFSYSARLRRGESRVQILWHAFKRSLLLIAIGLFVNGFPFIGIDWHGFRFEGVTQRIALCYFAAAILVLWSNPADKSSPSLHVYWDIGQYCASCQCLVSACQDAIYRLWTRMEILLRGSIASCSWDISTMGTAIQKESSTPSQPSQQPRLEC